MITWEDLAEEREMLAKAWTLRARHEVGRLQSACLHDAEEASSEARDFRDAQHAGAPLNQTLAFFMSRV